MKKKTPKERIPIPQQEEWDKEFYGKFYDKLTDLIEEEIYLATGNKSKKHWSGDCKINEIVKLIKQFIKNLSLHEKRELFERMEELIYSLPRRHIQGLEWIDVAKVHEIFNQLTN